MPDCITIKIFRPYLICKRIIIKNWRQLCQVLIQIGYQNHCVMVSGQNMVFLSRWEMNG